MAARALLLDFKRILDEPKHPDLFMQQVARIELVGLFVMMLLSPLHTGYALQHQINAIRL